jgi:hypothetical protein
MGRNLFNCRHLLSLVFTFLHTDLILSPSPRFETCDVDLFFTQQVQFSLHPNLLRKYVLYKLPSRYHMDIEIANPLIFPNNYLPGSMYHRTNMFSDIIPLVLNLLTAKAVKHIGTYRKILLRRFTQLQESSFNYWNEFFLILHKPIFMNIDSYSCRNRIDYYFIQHFIEGFQKSKKLAFYLSYTGEGLTNARLL